MCNAILMRFCASTWIYRSKIVRNYEANYSSLTNGTNSIIEGFSVFLVGCYLLKIRHVFCWGLGFLDLISVNYAAALTKTSLYYEAQRSGKLPPNQRVQWLGASGFKDGNDPGIDLVGGYYDAGDNMKFGFPMTFTVTMLAWSTVSSVPNSKQKRSSQMSIALDAIKWGTNYIIKAQPKPDVLYGQVGDADSDHTSWERPEDMISRRTNFKIDDQHPGAILAAETAAAFVAASIAFNSSKPRYATKLIKHAK